MTVLAMVLPDTDGESSDLVAGLRRRDPAAQRALYDRFGERVFRRAYRMCGGDVGLAEDLTQETFVRAFGRIGQFRGDARLSTWLHAVATSVILNGLRSFRRRAGREVDLTGADMVPTAANPIEPDLQRDLGAAMAALPSELRLVVTLFEVEGYTHDEIAEIAGISAGASRMRLSRARAFLRKRLRAHEAEWRNR